MPPNHEHKLPWQEELNDEICRMTASREIISRSQLLAPSCQSTMSTIGLPCGAKRTLSKPILTAAIMVADAEAGRSGETYFVASIPEPR
jgi:hypothetical protein